MKKHAIKIILTLTVVALIIAMFQAIETAAIHQTAGWTCIETTESLPYISTVELHTPKPPYNPETHKSGYCEGECWEATCPYFSGYPKPTNTPKPREVTYSPSNLDLLARLIQAEAGGDDCTDEHQLLVGNVVLNRIADARYPDTLYGVIYDRQYSIQYACAYNGALDKPASDRAIRHAERLLQGERFCPVGVVKQSERVQGEVYKSFKTRYTTTYFCF